MRVLVLALLCVPWPAVFAQAPAEVFTAEDSLLVRRILDLNGRQGVPVDSVTQLTTDRRLATFRLAGLGLTRLPPELGQLSFNNLFAQRNDLTELPLEVNDIFPLRNLLLDSNRFERFPGKFDRVNEVYMISLRYNRLKAITAEDMRRAALKEIIVLRLDHNQIDTLTPELARFRIHGLYLSHNRLANLPLELAGTSPGTLDVEYNRLCAVPDTLAAWITAHSLNKNWRSTQDCSTSLPRNRSGGLDPTPSNPSTPSDILARTCFDVLGLPMLREGFRLPLVHLCR